MNEFLRKTLNFISKSFGFFLINLSILLLIFAFFANSTLNNISSLENDLQGLAKEQINQSKEISVFLEQAKEYCKLNPSDENCEQLKNFDEDELVSEGLGFDKISKDLESIKSAIKLSFLVSIILFIFGFLFVYLSCFNLLNAGFLTSMHITINNFVLGVLFYLMPNLISNILNSKNITDILSQLPIGVGEKITEIILNWIKKPIFLTLRLTIILGIIFLIIILTLYLLKKKGLKGLNKNK